MPSHVDAAGSSAINGPGRSGSVLKSELDYRCFFSSDLRNAKVIAVCGTASSEDLFESARNSSRRVGFPGWLRDRGARPCEGSGSPPRGHACAAQMRKCLHCGVCSRRAAHLPLDDLVVVQREQFDSYFSRSGFRFNGSAFVSEMPEHLVIARVWDEMSSFVRSVRPVRSPATIASVAAVVEIQVLGLQFRKRRLGSIVVDSETVRPPDRIRLAAIDAPTFKLRAQVRFKRPIVGIPRRILRPDPTSLRVGERSHSSPNSTSNSRRPASSCSIVSTT